MAHLVCSAARPGMAAVRSPKPSPGSSGEMDYVPHFQFGHPSSFELASRIARITPEGIDHVFFCNSGSEAIDTALKIVMAYHQANGEGHRVRFVSRERAYHGVNIGGTSLSGIMRNREAFPAVLPNVVHMRHTQQKPGLFVRGQPEHGADLAGDLQRFCDLYGGHTIAACFVEPIAGSTGVLVPPKGYLQRLRDICDRHGILLVFDEVICGFGRTGRAFGADSFEVTPDLMTMAKAITNGAQPMGAVAVSEAVWQAIAKHAPEETIELFHGYTFSAHPAAAAAALAALDIYDREALFDTGGPALPVLSRPSVRTGRSAGSDRHTRLRPARRLRPRAERRPGSPRLRLSETPV